MRVIAGSARRLLLQTVPDKSTRPTTDKIKETLFNILSFDLDNVLFLDIFAGSGAIGIEALSRGAKKAIFIEKNKKAVDCIKQNLIKTKLIDKAEILSVDVMFALQKINMNFSDIYDIIFMDPPYNMGLENECLDFLHKSNMINDDTLIIVEMSKNTDISHLIEQWNITKIKEYKNNKHIFLRRRSNV